MVFKAYSSPLTFYDSMTFTSSGGHFQAKSPAVQAEAVLFTAVELVHLSDHCPKLKEQKKPLGCILACGIAVCSNSQLSGYHCKVNMTLTTFSRCKPSGSVKNAIAQRLMSRI